MKQQYFKKILLVSVISSLMACGSSDDNENKPTEPPENTPPVATESSRAADSNQTLIINPMLHVTAADEADILSLTHVSSTKGKVAILSDNRIEFDPEGFAGEATINYTVTDGTDDASSTITISSSQAIFAGTETCLNCHGSGSPFMDVSSHQLHGHNFKISKINNDETPSFPYSDVSNALQYLHDSSEGVDNTLGKPISYADVTYTSGGFGWKYRWMDKDGYIVTGKEAQFNIHAETLGLDDQIMVNYNGGSVNKPYNCGHCHTTGWKPYSEELYPQKQDDLPGIEGTFLVAGVQCESCHGAGLAHAKTADKELIVRKATPRSTTSLQSETMGYGEAIHCAECHTRDGDRNVRNNYVSNYSKAFPDGLEYGARVEVKSGLPRHHQGHDEFMGVDPDTGVSMGKHFNANMTCSTCHDSHKSTLHKDQPEHSGAFVKQCTTCHSDKTEFNVDIHGPEGYVAKECIDCHMPDVVKNATSMTNAKGNKVGDIRIHTFAIDLFNEKGQFTEDGKFMYPYLQDGFACGECHEQGEKLESMKANYSGKMHKN